MTFDFKIVLGKLYFFIVLLWIPFIIIFSMISIKFLNDDRVIPSILFIGFLSFIFFHKPIMKRFFTRELSIFFADDEMIVELKKKRVQLNLNYIISYRILFTEPKYYRLEINIEHKKFVYPIIGEENSIGLLDFFHKSVIDHNCNGEKSNKIKFTPPIGMANWYKNALKIAACLLSVSFLLHLYFSPITSIGTFLVAVSSVTSAYSNNITGLQFYNHLNAGNMISTFKKIR